MNIMKKVLAVASGVTDGFGVNQDLRGSAKLNVVDFIVLAYAQVKLEFCNLLKKMGLDPDNRFIMPMHLACKSGNLELCQWLFDNIPEEERIEAITIEDRDITPMSVACKNGHLHVCKWLYQKIYEEALNEIKDKKPQEAHAIAQKYARLEITEGDSFGNKPMYYASESGNLEVCQWLVEVGANISIASRLVEANISIASRLGITTMMLACYSGNLKLCKWLYANGAANDIVRSVEISGEMNSDGEMDSLTWSPMMEACRGGYLDICEWLFKHMSTQQRVETFVEVYGDGWTPMRIACENGHLDICKWIIINVAFIIKGETKIDLPAITKFFEDSALKHIEALSGEFNEDIKELTDVINILITDLKQKSRKAKKED